MKSAGNKDELGVKITLSALSTFYFTLLFSHLADAFIQSNLQIRKSN